MSSFHISPDGTAGRCGARPGHCPFKSEHYRTLKEAAFHAASPEPLTLAEQTLSRKVAFLLRHHPEQANLTPDQYGQVSVTALAEAVKASPDIITRLVLLDKKQRYLFSNNHKLVSAVQGHSYPVQLRAISTTPPPFLFHGTKQQFLDSIKAGGLRPGSRQHVHLSANEDTAGEVAARRNGESILLTVDTQKAINAGVTFQQAPNGVWLAPTVPAEAIQFPT